MAAVSHETVAAETGYPVHEVISRGVSFCRKNPRAKPAPDDAFSQLLGDEFEAEIVAAVEAEAPVAEPDLTADIDRVAAHFYDPDAVARRLKAAGATAARVAGAGTPDAVALAIFLRHEPAEGGTSIVGRIGRTDVFRTAGLSDDELVVLEPLYLNALHAFAAGIDSREMAERIAA